MDVLSALLIALSGIVIVFIMLIVLCLLIPVISKIVQTVQHRMTPAAPAAPPAPAAVPAPSAASAVQGEVVLIDTDEKTAACIMAIVSHETGIPLSELIFHKIKAV